MNPDQSLPEPKTSPVDPTRVTELVELLGAVAYLQFVAELAAQCKALATHSGNRATPGHVAASLHRLQGSASALGLIETAAIVTRTAQRFASASAAQSSEARFAQLDRDLGQAGLALASARTFVARMLCHHEDDQSGPRSKL